MKSPTRPSFQESHRQLRGAQKSSKGAPLYSLVVNRPSGRVLAALAHQFGLTPNQVTVVSAIFTFSGIVIIALMPPGLGMALGVALLLVIGYALDAADGQLARLRGGGSLTGEWLDHVIDSFKVATLHLAVLISMYRFFDLSDQWLIVPILFSAMYVIHFFGMLLTELLTRNAQLLLRSVPDAAKGSSWMRSLIKLPTDYGLLCLSFVLFARPAVFQWVYLVLALAMAAYTVLVLPAWYRRLKSLDSKMGASG